jgi:hypothetical protein
VVAGSDVGCGKDVVVEEVGVEEVVVEVVAGVGSGAAGVCRRDGVIAAAKNAPTTPKQDHLTKARRSRRRITHDTYGQCLVVLRPVAAIE